MIPKFTYPLLTRVPSKLVPVLFLLLLSTTTSWATCKADAGSLGTPLICEDADKTVISATPNGDAYVPDGFVTLYVLTSGDELVIEQISPQPTFAVDPMGAYTIHTLVFNPKTLDLGLVVPGETTGFQVNELLRQGGGSICAALDVPGAKFIFDSCPILCGAFAGTLEAKGSDCLQDDKVLLEAEIVASPIVPDGFALIYVLTKGDDLVIMNTNDTPEFEVDESGMFTIHTLVYDPNTLDLNRIVPGTTTGIQVNNALLQGGGNICGALDVPGAKFEVKDCASNCEADFGAIKAKEISCFNGYSWVRVAAKEIEEPSVPYGFQVVYILTSGDNLTIRAASRYPVFFVRGTGKVRIHTLVYDPNTLDLGIIKAGKTEAAEVLGLLIQGGGDICAALDVEGAPFVLRRCSNHANASDLRSNNANEDIEVQIEEDLFKSALLAPNVFPNPVIDDLNIQLPTTLVGDQEVEMLIYNSFGQQVRSSSLKAGTSRTSIDVANLSDGWYIIRFQIGEVNFQSSFTKAKR